MVNWKRNLFFLWISQFLSLAGFSFGLPFVPFYLRELGLSDPETVRIWSGLFMAAAGIPLAIATPIWGILADRYGRKPMILRANLGAVVVLVGMGLARSPEMLLVFRVMQGFLTGTVTANLTLVVTATPQHKMGLALGLMNSGVFAGATIGPLIGGIVADSFGFRASFFIAAALMLFSFLVALVFVREDFKPGQAGLFRFIRGLGPFLKERRFITTLGLIALLGFARFMLRPVYPLFIEEIASSRLGIATQTGIVNAAAGVAAVVAGIVIGRMADRGKKYRLGFFCLLFAGFLRLPQGFARQVWQLIPFRFGSDFFAAGVDPILNTLLAQHTSPERRGTAFGLAGSMKAIGWSSGSMLGAAVAAFWGFKATVVVNSVVFVLAALLLILAWDRRNET